MCHLCKYSHRYTHTGAQKNTHTQTQTFNKSTHTKNRCTHTANMQTVFRPFLRSGVIIFKALCDFGLCVFSPTWDTYFFTFHSCSCSYGHIKKYVPQAGNGPFCALVSLHLLSSLARGAKMLNQGPRPTPPATTAPLPHHKGPSRREE